MSINDISNKLKISYDITKQRLHRLEKSKIISRTKRGLYVITSLYNDFTIKNRDNLKSAELNGSVRRQKGWGGIRLTVYNSIFANMCGNKYCDIKFNDNKITLRKSNEYFGNKIYKMKCNSADIPISGKILLNKIVLTNKCQQMKIIFYPEEWEIPIERLLGTEHAMEGELAKSLIKFGNVEKFGRKENVKSDLVFFKDNLEVPIEITTIKVNSDKKGDGRRSGIKAYQILGKLYYCMKLSNEYKIPNILILHESWKNMEWLLREEEYLKQFNITILYTDFENKWAKTISSKIDKISNHLVSSTTRLSSL